MNEQESTTDNANDPTNPAPIGDAAKQAWDTTREKAGEVYQSGERYVRDNPGTSALTIFGFGMALGVLVGWSIAHEERDSCSDTARRLAKILGNKLNLD